jgi:hypothetical protein
MVGFKKDLEICLTPRPHPTASKPTVAFSPATITCCATLEFLTCLFLGILGTPGPAKISKFTARYLPGSSYEIGTLAVLFNMIRHSVAHRGILNGVWVERPDQRDSRRIAWKLSDANQVPAIDILDERVPDHHAPWRCTSTHRIHVNIGRLYREIHASALLYADDLASDAELQRKLLRYMEYIFPKG